MTISKRLLLTMAALLFAPSMVQAQEISWQGWEFSYSTNNNSSGLVLSDVTRDNKKILAKVSMPVMRVEYDNDVCGPYADIMSIGARSNRYSTPNNLSCNTEGVCQRTFTRNGEEMLEIGSNWQIGEYQIYQTYYFSENGYFDARVYSRGLQCRTNHSHHAHWMFDFDIGDSDNDFVSRESGDPEQIEFNDLKSNSDFWTIGDSVSGDFVQVTPSSDDGTVDNFSAWDVAVRAYRSSEVGRWRLGARGEIGNNYLNNENVNGADVVFWYVSHLPHNANEGSSIWHASGPRIQIGTAADPDPTPEPEPDPDPAPDPEPEPDPVGDNLLANGGFEDDQAGWFECGNAANTTVRSVNATEGTQSLNVTNGGCLYQEVAVLPGSSHTLSCDASRTGNNWTILEFGYLSANYTSLESNTVQVSSSGTFANYELTGTAPDGSVYALVLVYSEDATDFDNCRLTAGGSTNPTPPPTPTPPGGDNLLTNAGFESGLNNWNSCADASLLSESSDADSGIGSLGITGGGCLYQEFPISSGETYRMDCRAKKAGTNWASLTLALQDSDYVSLTTEELPVTGSTYTDYSTSLTAPDGVQNGVVVMYGEVPTNFDSCSVVVL